jgi:L-arabinose isomerase
MKTHPTSRVGLFSIGLDTYWAQFTGLKDNLLGYHSRVKSRLEALGLEVVDAGLVDNPDVATSVGDRFRSENVEAVFLFITTYALSSTVLPVVRRAGVPVIVLNLQPVPQLDYDAFNALKDRGHMTGVWLEHCQACCAPEIACVFHRAGIPFYPVTGYLEEDAAWEEIGDWAQAISVRKGLQENRMGVLGHYYCGMLDVYSDLTTHSAVFGTHFELLEMCEAHAIWEAVDETRIAAKLGEFQEAFDVSEDCEASELERAARTAVALDELVDRHHLGSMAYYYEGQPGNSYENIVTSVIAGNTLLTGRNVPVAGECEIKNAHAMKIMDLFGAGGSFSEYYLADFKDGVLYFGHDGPAHFAIAEGRVGLVPLSVYHGKPGKGLSIQMTVRNGPVTLLSVVQRADGTLALLMAEGESVPGPVLAIGNTNSRYQFALDPRDFMNRWNEAGPAHHCAIGVGHIAGRLEKLARLLGISAIRL